MNISSTRNKIGDEIKKLDLNHEDGENYQKCLEFQLSTQVNSCVDIGHIPVFFLSQCACGCGETNFAIDTRFMNKNQAKILLKEIVEEIEEESKNVN